MESEEQYLPIKVRKLTPDATIPCYAHPGDAGLDLCANEDAVIEPGQSQLIPTGISVELPKNTEAQVRPRSGLALKHQVTVLNSPGTVDEGYRGQVSVILINHGRQPFYVKKGMKIAQMIISSVLRADMIEVNELSKTERGTGGFGSTGLKNRSQERDE